jgi:hypothetical protein
MATVQKMETVPFFRIEQSVQPAAAVSAIGTYPEELMDDQVAYLHEQAAERRRRWEAHKARSTTVEA